jgi:hAT family C-terminal dimerisation region
VSLKEHQKHYPTIFTLVMDALPIQASAVPCERVFSSAKETMAPWQNRISPDLMDALQLLKFTLRNGRSLDFTSGLSYMDELHEMEEEVSEEDDVPEDLTSFVQSLLSPVS